MLRQIEVCIWFIIGTSNTLQSTETMIHFKKRTKQRHRLAETRIWFNRTTTSPGASEVMTPPSPSPLSPLTQSRSSRPCGRVGGAQPSKRGWSLWSGCREPARSQTGGWFGALPSLGQVARPQIHARGGAPRRAPGLGAFGETQPLGATACLPRRGTQLWEAFLEV